MSKNLSFEVYFFRALFCEGLSASIKDRGCLGRFVKDTIESLIYRCKSEVSAITQENGHPIPSRSRWMSGSSKK